MARRPVAPDLSWITRLRDEVATLPETLRAFRETVEDLRTVAKRLEGLTEVMERTQAHLDALGVTDSARQLDDAVVAVETQLSALRGSVPGGAGGALDDAVQQMRKTASDMSELGFRMFGVKPPRGDRGSS